MARDVVSRVRERIGEHAGIRKGASERERFRGKRRDARDGGRRSRRGELFRLVDNEDLSDSYHARTG
jgi:hypothetical protein